MDESILGPEGARERLAAWKGRLDRLAADTQAMSERMQAARVTANDPNGLVEVTVDATGALVGLRLSDRTQRAAPAVVAGTIMATLADAKKRMAAQSQVIIAETMGTESAAGKAISESVGQHLREAPAPSLSPPAPPPPVSPPTPVRGPTRKHAAPRDDDDEGYDSHSYLRRD
ncbi:YbaB/EbfC family nucleoid-associated protein [Amycolatopsis sp. 195334CR]|uniref:YbaB/EbfC family nucleoid-associated protein n=1 Tax=Amycolatopsis sp. 195334CR TaxID=2814588 RepID=UPI001A8EDD41|nr:YbaB/EbfC family nucleoid-associated protein [Amycolatopsis sp. 195334CR]MBN6039107.1 YbaB/EbfC family nucleoid-associated protein [Amycolatopsis sp. 195334CR]